jgi:hypothetical protein
MSYDIEGIIAQDLAWKAPKPRRALVARFFDAMDYYRRLEADVEDAMLEIFDIDPLDPNKSFPFSDWTFDSYDESMELLHCKIDWKPTPMQVRRIFGLGFNRFWVNYPGGSQIAYMKDGAHEGRFSPTGGRS